MQNFLDALAVPNTNPITDTLPIKDPISIATTTSSTPVPDSIPPITSLPIITSSPRAPSALAHILSLLGSVTDLSHLQLTNTLGNVTAAYLTSSRPTTPLLLSTSSPCPTSPIALVTSSSGIDFSDTSVTFSLPNIFLDPTNPSPSLPSEDDSSSSSSLDILSTSPSISNHLLPSTNPSLNPNHPPISEPPDVISCTANSLPPALAAVATSFHPNHPITPASTPFAMLPQSTQYSSPESVGVPDNSIPPSPSSSSSSQSSSHSSSTSTIPHTTAHCLRQLHKHHRASKYSSSKILKSLLDIWSSAVNKLQHFQYHPDPSC